MNSLASEAKAVVILQAGVAEGVRSPALRRWLGRTNVTSNGRPAEGLSRALDVLGVAAPRAGCAALRLWGQSGDRPANWVAAADPVYLEARLDHLCLHRLGPDELPAADLEPLFAELQAALGAADDLEFMHLASSGYLCGGQPISTPALSADSLDGAEPSAYLPAGDGAARFHRLLSEIEMCLHQSPVQSRRIAASRRPVNALWIWGGGRAPETGSLMLPALYSDDPLLRGFWLSASAPVRAPSERLADCAAETGGAFVTSIARPLESSGSSDTLAGSIEGKLAELQRALRRGLIRELHLLFSDGVTVRVQGYHRFRFWRRPAAPFDTPVPL